MSSGVRLRFPPYSPAIPFREAVEALASSDRMFDAGFDERIDVLDAVSKRLLDPTSPIRQSVPTDGLAYLAGFLQRSNLKSQVERELADCDSLRTFARLAGRKSIRHVPRGLVCHWIAGNVPLLALFSWAISVVLGNRNIIRISSRQGDSVSPILQLLETISPSAKAIANETIVVSFDVNDDAAHSLMSEVADVRIAWGGAEAVHAIRSLDARWDCEDVIFGPRVSMAVVDPETLNEAALRRLATDAVLFDQFACSSPQSIFVKAGRDTPLFETFRDRFCRAFSSASGSYPRHGLDFSESYRIELDRARLILEGAEVDGDSATTWTVAVVDSPNDTVQCANRFVQMVPFKDLEQVYRWIPKNIQTIVVRLSRDDFEQFTNRAANLGVCRFPMPGEGNNFENPWDGIGLVSRLTRTVTRTEFD